MIKKIAIIVLVALIHFYFYSSENVKKIDYAVYDWMMAFSNQVKKNDAFYTVVIEIDEKSIQELGQWPWARVITSKIIDEISKLNPSALGVNILFPEVDRLSPINIQEFYKKFFELEVAFKQLYVGLKDNDKLLLNTIANGAATLATSFYNNAYTSKHCEALVYKQNIFALKEIHLTADTFLCNHEQLQKGVKNFGFINAWKDADGIFRRVPLFMKYQDKVFPSFALATLLSFDESIDIKSKEDMVLLNFSSQKPKVFSAIDIFRGNIPIHEIQGKIVVLGSSLLGLTPMYTTPLSDKISNNMIHAIAIDNFLNDNFLRQPSEYKVVNILLSFVFSLWMVYLFSKKGYLKIMLLFSFSFILNFLATFYFYLDNIYLSTAYFLVPFLSFFIVLIIYHLWVISKEQQEQEKLFIRQSKLASMGEMISLIAHQWRQPLSAINGTVLNLDMDYRKQSLDAKKFDNYLNDIEGTTAYLSKTINDFTDFFSHNKEMETFNLFKVIEQVKLLSGIATAKNMKFYYRSEEEIVITGYRTELIQSLLVLLSNAIYVCQENLDNDIQGKIIIEAKLLNKNILISIEDNGGGVDKKDINKVFNPYFTSKDKHNGTGLGLYILKLIIEDSMNGKVSVVNGKEGAIFSIEIPQNIN